MLAAPSPGHLLGTTIRPATFSAPIYGAPATSMRACWRSASPWRSGCRGLIAGFFGGWIDDIISR